MEYYSWRPGYEHDWLAVDKDGHMGYFMSAYADVLPEHVLIPWQYLHNLSSMWIAYATNTSYANIRKLAFPHRDVQYEELISTLTATGISVWDAGMDHGECVFEKVGSPEHPLNIEATHVFFQKIAKCFSARHCSFEKSLVLREVKFENCSHIEWRHMCQCSLVNAWTIPNEELLEVMASSRNFDISLIFADRCMIDGAPSNIGPTFSCWNAVRDGYVNLVKAISEKLNCKTIVTRDFLGVERQLNMLDFMAMIYRMPLPFHSLLMRRPDGCGVLLRIPKHHVNGGVSYNWNTGAFNCYDDGIRIEDWYFEVSLEEIVSDGHWYSKMASALRRLCSRKSSPRRYYLV